MKRALSPILLLLLVIGLLIVLNYWYEKRWGIEGPFQHEHRN